MKHKLKTTTFFLFLFFSFAAQSKSLLIDLKIDKAISDKIIFSYPTNLLTEEVKSFAVNINTQGEAYTSITVEDYISFLNVAYNRQSFKIFIGDLTQVSFMFAADNIFETLKFSGKGSLDNEFLNNKNHRLSLGGIKVTVTKGHLFSLVDDRLYGIAQSEKDFEGYRKQLKKPKEEVAAEVSQQVVDYLNIQNEYQYYINELTFFLAHQDDMSSSYLEGVAMANEVLKDVPFQVDFLLTYDFYTNFLQTYIYVMYLRGQSAESNAALAMYDLSNRLLKGESKEWMLCKILLNAHREQDLSVAEKKFFSLKRSATNQGFVKTVADLYGTALVFNGEGAAPVFALKNEKGELISLADYKDKVVYISFWASWCKPCLSGFTKTEGIRHQLKDRGVVLMNICLDENEEVWQRTMARIPMPGINLFASADTPLKLKYDLSRLPAYFIVNKAGNFAYLGDTGYRDLLEEFDKLMEE